MNSLCFCFNYVVSGLRQFLIIIICLMTYDQLWADCNSKHEILHQPNSQALERNIPKMELNANCYFYVGQAFFAFYKQETDPIKKIDLLTKAQTNLNHARSTLSQSDSEYKSCYQLLIIIESLSQDINLTTIHNYHNAIHQNTLINADLRNRLINRINLRLREYNSNFLDNDYPQDEVQFAATYGFDSEEIRAIPGTYRFKTQYSQLLHQFNTNPHRVQRQNVQEMLNLLRQRESMRNITPYILACRSWMNYYDHVSEQAPSTAAEHCNLYNRAIAQLGIAQQTFSFAVDACNISCKKDFYCNANNINTQAHNLITNISAQNIRQKIETCNSHIQRYSSTISACFITPPVEDQRPYLSEIQTFLSAMGDYFTRGDTSIRLVRLTHFFQNTIYINLKRLAGHYIGWVYYDQLRQKLLSGPGTEAQLVVLNRIQSTLNSYQTYATHVTIPGDQINYATQYTNLNNFFRQQTIASMRAFLPEISTDLKRLWGVQRHLQQLLASVSTPTQNQTTANTNVSTNATQPEQPSTINSPNIATEPTLPITEAAEGHPSQSIPNDTNDSLTPLQNAVNAFDHFEYYDALEYYKQAYQNIDIESLNPVDLESSTWGWTSSSSSQTIRVSDRNKIALLLYMKQISQSANKPAQISSIMSQNREYPVEIAWHFAELNHERQEKSSDSSFFSGLAYFMSNNPQIQLNTIDHFINAWRSLNDSALFIAGETIKQRTRKKLERVQYWIKKVWRNYTPQEKNVIKNKYRTGDQIFRVLFQIVIGDPLNIETTVTSLNQNNSLDNSSLERTISETNIPPSRSHPQESSEQNALTRFIAFANRINNDRSFRLNCDNIRQFRYRISGTQTVNCLDRFIAQAKAANESSSDRDKNVNYVQLYLAWAKIRKREGNKNKDWVENLMWAYLRAHNRNSRDDISDGLRSEILNELQIAKQRLHDQHYVLPRDTIEKMRTYRFYDVWNNLSVTAATNMYQQPNGNQVTSGTSTDVADARRRATQYARLTRDQCNQNIREIYIFFNELVETYTRTHNAELLKIYDDHITNIKCFTVEDRNRFDLRFR